MSHYVVKIQLLSISAFLLCSCGRINLLPIVSENSTFETLDVLSSSTEEDFSTSIYEKSTFEESVQSAEASSKTTISSLETNSHAESASSTINNEETSSESVSTFPYLSVNVDKEVVILGKESFELSFKRNYEDEIDVSLDDDMSTCEATILTKGNDTYQITPVGDMGGRLFFSINNHTYSELDTIMIVYAKVQICSDAFVLNKDNEYNAAVSGVGFNLDSELTSGSLTFDESKTSSGLFYTTMALTLNGVSKTYFAVKDNENHPIFMSDEDGTTVNLEILSDSIVIELSEGICATIGKA